MIADEQIHTLPSDPAAMERFAQFCGFADRQEFADALVARLQKVQSHYSILFEPSAVSPQPNLIFQKESDDRATLDRLTELGFRNPLEISATIRSWLAGRYPALRGEFARGQLMDFIPHLLDQLSKSEHREFAFVMFDRFCRSFIPAEAGGCSRCCGRIRPCWFWSGSFSATRRGLRISWRSIRRSWMR